MTIGSRRVFLKRLLLPCVVGAGWALGATPAAADDAPKVRCKARLWRTPDDKEARYVSAVVSAGKSVEALDGDRDFKVVPASVIGLRVVFRPTIDGDKVALHADALYRTYVVTREGNQIWIAASSAVDASLGPADQYDVALDINGTPYTLTLWAQRI